MASLWLPFCVVPKRLPESHALSKFLYYLNTFTYPSQPSTGEGWGEGESPLHHRHSCEEPAPEQSGVGIHSLATHIRRHHGDLVFEGHVVGGVGLRIDRRGERADLGYALAKQHWGKGLTLEAARAVIGWGFERYGVHKVIAHAALDNRQSWRVMEKLGMTREGLKRSHSKIGGEFVDYVDYGVLREEWERSA